MVVFIPQSGPRNKFVTSPSDFLCMSAAANENLRDAYGIAVSFSDSLLSARAGGATTDRVFAMPAALPFRSQALFCQPAPGARSLTESSRCLRHSNYKYQFSKDKHPCSSLSTSEVFLWFMLWLPVGMPAAGLATTGYYSFSFCREG